MNLSNKKASINAGLRSGEMSGLEQFAWPAKFASQHTVVAVVFRVDKL